jgi:Cu2+-exporting ATPase
MDHSQRSMDATSHAGPSMAAMNHGAPGMAAGAHDKHAGHSVAMFRDKFWLSLALIIPVVIWSRDPQKWLGYTAPTFPGSDLIPAILGTVLFLYGGLVFLRGARGELAGRQPAMSGSPSGAAGPEPTFSLPG